MGTAERTGVALLLNTVGQTVKSSAKPWLSRCLFYNERCLRLQAKKHIHSGEVDKLTN